MEQYKRYYGVITFVVAVTLIITLSITKGFIPYYNDYTSTKEKVATVTQTLEEKRAAKAVIVRKLKKLKESVMISQKKIYSPTEEKLENDTLFFTLYSDLIDMVHSNTVKIKSIDYAYNPAGDIFVEQGKSAYFVCDVTMEIVSNYINLGKLIQDIYQYPYYIKINDIDVIPYPKDKKILLSKISVRLYAHTSPDTYLTSEESEAGATGTTINGAATPIPQ